MDDDIVYNVYELLKVLQLVPPTDYLGGNIFPASPPYRGNSKWRVTADEWPRALYPPYVSGMGPLPTLCVRYGTSTRLTCQVWTLYLPYVSGMGPFTRLMCQVWALYPTYLPVVDLAAVLRCHCVYFQAGSTS